MDSERAKFDFEEAFLFVYSLLAFCFCNLKTCILVEKRMLFLMFLVSFLSDVFKCGILALENGSFSGRE